MRAWVWLQSYLEILKHFQNRFWQKWVSKLVLEWDAPLGDLSGRLLSVWSHSSTWEMCHYPRFIVLCSSDYHLSLFLVCVCATHSIEQIEIWSYFSTSILLSSNSASVRKEISVVYCCYFCFLIAGSFFLSIQIPVLYERSDLVTCQLYIRGYSKWHHF